MFRWMSVTMTVLSLAAAEEKSLFNGKDLTGWTGVDGFWTVEDGAITGRTTAENPAKKNTFLVWQGEASDFVLTFRYRLLDADGEGAGYANSGVQYRSRVVDASYSVVSGYQADMELGKNYSGILYEEKGRGILAKRGQQVVIHECTSKKGFKIEVRGETEASDAIQAAIRQGDWNDYKIVAKGKHLQHYINGKLCVDVTDQTAAGARSGVIALQLHQGKPMTAQFKDLLLVTE